MTTIKQCEREAWELGCQHARNAASWVADGNTKPDTIRRTLALLDDGDPEAYDRLPARPNLSGEWAGDMTPARLLEELGLDWPDESEGDALLDAVCDAYERGVDETFEDACVTELRKWVS